MKKFLILILLIIVSSCSNQQRTTISEEPLTISQMLIGKWSSFGSITCKSYLYFGESGIFSENIYDSNCVARIYPGTYTLNNNVIAINNTNFIIVSIDKSTLSIKQQNPSSSSIVKYTKID